MAVTMSLDDFSKIYAVLQKVNSPFTHEDAGAIVLGEAEAWRIVQRVAEEQGVVTHTADPHA